MKDYGDVRHNYWVKLFTEMKLDLWISFRCKEGFVMRVSTNEIKTLSKMRSKLAVSIYIKMAQGPGNIEKNRIHLKNTLRDIVMKSQKVGYSRDELHDMCECIMSRVTEEKGFIKGDGQTLVIFASAQILKTHYLHVEFEEQYYVGIEFVTLPLSRAIEQDQRFLVLALSQGKTRLFEASKSEMRELHLSDLPGDMVSGLNIDEMTPQIQSHGSGRIGAGGDYSMHGQGGIKDSKKKLIQEYFRRIDTAINKNLKKRGLPLLVFGVDYLHPIYRKISSYPIMLGKGIVGSPDKMSLYDLHRDVLQEANKYFNGDSEIPRAFA